MPDAVALTDLFCKIDPSRPTIGALTKLINRCLAAATNGTCRVDLTIDNGDEVWRLIMEEQP